MDDMEFDGFFRDYMTRLVTYLVQLGAGHSAAEDVAMEAMMQAYEQWGTIAHPKAWVRTVAYRKLIKLNAERRRQDWSPLGDDQVGSADDLKVYGLGEEEERVLRVLRTLPPEQRSVFVLHYEGCSTKEIADTLRKSEATVRSTLRHARTRLREQLSGEDTYGTGMSGEE